MSTQNIILPSQVADFIISFANDVGETLTHLKLQKLVYYSQAWFLANNDVPLFQEDFQAWVHGPVLRSLYDECNGVYPNSQIIKVVNRDVLSVIPEKITDFLNEICEVYMPYGGYELELMTHNELPWKEARGSLDTRLNSENIISKETMKTYYNSLIA